MLLLGTAGVYGLVAASAGPLVAGLFLRGHLPPAAAVASASVALAIHFGLYLGGGVSNPGISAMIALLVAVPLALILCRVLAQKTAHGAKARAADVRVA